MRRECHDKLSPEIFMKSSGNLTIILCKFSMNDREVYSNKFVEILGVKGPKLLSDVSTLDGNIIFAERTLPYAEDVGTCLQLGYTFEDLHSKTGYTYQPKNRVYFPIFFTERLKRSVTKNNLLILKRSVTKNNLLMFLFFWNNSSFRSITTVSTAIALE